MRSLAKALHNRNRLSVYAWATTTAEITQWLQTKGPVVVGTDWYYDMMDPPASGVIQPTGGVAGGHAYVLVGAVDKNANPSSTPGFYLMQNSWGRSWGKDGTALIDIGDFGRVLLARDGEALVTVELPLG